MKRIAIVAAMPGELKPLVRGWQHEHRAGVEIWRKSSGESEWIAACAGAGQQAATRAVAALEESGPLHAIVSVGWVGALGEEYLPGHSYRIAGVIDAQTGERFEAATCPLPPQPGKAVLKGHGFSRAARVLPTFASVSSPAQAGELTEVFPQGLKPNIPRECASGTAKAVPFQNGTSGIWLVTSPRVVDAAEKQRLASAYGAGLVDMEAAAVARLAAMRGIPFFVIKGVSDGVGDKLPDFNRFLGPAGEFRLIRLILFVIPRPWLWSALVRMGENSNKASCAMAKDLCDLLAVERP